MSVCLCVCVLETEGRENGVREEEKNLKSIGVSDRMGGQGR